MRRKSSTFDACQLEKLAVRIATRLAGWDTPSIRWFVGLLGLTNHSGQTLFRNLPTVSTVATVTWSTRLFPVIGWIQTIIPIQGCGNYSLAYRRISFRKGPCDMCPNMPRRFFFLHWIKVCHSILLLGSRRCPECYVSSWFTPNCALVTCHFSCLGRIAGVTLRWCFIMDLFCS